MATGAERFRWTLGRRLIAVLGAVALAGAAALLTVIAPATDAALHEFGAEMLADGGEAMRLLSRRQTRQTSEVLADLIRYTGTARERAVRDLPLESYGQNVAAIRAAVLRDDAERTVRQRRNVEVLAAEIERRADTEIQRRIAELRSHQEARRAAFIAEQSRAQLVLFGATLAALLALLGLGLHRLVVRPAARLRQATRRVAAGDLGLELPAPGSDELGDLTRDFAAMVGQLRTSRDELQQFAARLEAEVEKQTLHLQQALADLKASHRQLAEAERRAALGTLAGGIAHEFHNLIGGIRGCAAELLADERDGERRETLGVITRAADRATGIVHQLQRFARHSVDRRAEVDLAAVVGDALRLCEPAARRQGVAIERELTAGVRVHGDADSLHQVFVNLLVNALQAMPDGGALRVVAAADGAAAVAAIADTGAGIAPEHLPHVFEPFFTTRAGAAEPAQRGSGLGLSVSYGIVTAHGGSITVASTPGRGTEFTVRLPRIGAA